jgi:YVTN family beta-propeller protein
LSRFSRTVINFLAVKNGKNGRPERDGTTSPTVDRLDSWKEIAAYLKREVRTIQRWEKTQGLPVRRHNHGKGPTVYAFKAELDAWWNNGQSQLPEEPAGRRRWVLAGVAALILTSVGLAVWRFGGPLMRAQGHARNASVPGRLFVSFTSEGRAPVWISVGKTPERAVMTNGGEIYVANSLDETVSVIATRTNTVTHTVRVAPRPDKLAMSPDGSFVFVTSYQGELFSIDTRTKKVLRIDADGAVSAIAVTPDGRRLYLAAKSRGLKVLTIGTNKLETIPSASEPFYLALAPSGSPLFVNYQGGGPGGRPGHDSIDLLDTARNVFVKNISGPPNVGGELAVSPDGTQVWASGGDACQSPAYDHEGCPPAPHDHIVNIIRTSDAQVLHTLAFGAGTGNPVSFFPDSSRAIVGGKPLRVLDARSLIATEALESNGSVVLFTPDLQRAYVVERDRNAVLAADLSRAACVPEPRGLVAWWPGDGTASDVRGTNHGRLVGSARFGPGRIGQAFSFDGAGGFVSLGDLGNLNGLATSEYTLAAWVKPVADGAEMPILTRSTALESLDRQNRTLVHWNLIRERDGRFTVCIAAGVGSIGCPAGAPGTTSRSAFRAGTWVHIAVAKTESKIELYMNGALEGSSAFAPIPGYELPGEVRLAASADGRSFFNGLVDEVQWFGRILSAAEIKLISQAVDAGICAESGARTPPTV